MLSVVSECHSVFTGEGGASVKGLALLPSPDIFKLVHVRPYCAGTPPPPPQTCLNLFIMKHVRSTSGQLTSYWKGHQFSSMFIQYFRIYHMSRTNQGKNKIFSMSVKSWRILNRLKCVNPVFPFPYVHRFEFFQNSQSWQYCISVLLKFENKLERQSITSILIQSTTTIESDSAFNCFQFISIRSRTKMPILPTSAL